MRGMTRCADREGQEMTTATTPAAEPYARITARILADLEQGVRPWTKPWSAGHLGGRVVRPLRATGEPYSGINTLLLWMEAVAAGYSSPTWMTYRQSRQLGGQVRKGEKGTPVVYYGRTTKTRCDEDTGEEADQDVRFLKTYTVFNVDQIDRLPERFQAAAAPFPALSAPERVAAADAFFAATGAELRHGGGLATTRLPTTGSSCRPSRRSATPRATTSPSVTRRCIGRAIRRGSIGISGAGAGATKATAERSWSPSWARRSWPPISTSPWSHARTMPPTSRRGSKSCRTTSARSSRPPRTPSVRSGTCTVCSPEPAPR